MSNIYRRTAPVIGALVATLAFASALRAQDGAAPADLASTAVVPVTAQAPVPSPAVEPVRAAAAAAPLPAQPAPARVSPRAGTPAPPPPPPPLFLRTRRTLHLRRRPHPRRPRRRWAPERRPRAAAAPGRRGRTARAVRLSKGINIRIDATIAESRGEQVLGKKVVTVTVVDGRSGQVRSTQAVPIRMQTNNAVNYQNAPLNMDAEALLRDDGRVLVSLTLDYRGAGTEPGAEATTLDQGIRQSVTVVLESGKPLIVAQSADAVGDRRVALEVKATVLK